MAFARTERRNFVKPQSALQMQCAEENRAWRFVLHDPGGGRLPPQRIENDSGDRRTILRSGETMREAPIFQRVLRRTPPREYIIENFDRCGNARTWCHGSVM